jgi:hypothetical protein
MTEYGAEGDAVHRKEHQVADLEEAYEETHREIDGEPGSPAAHEGLTPNAVAEMTGEVRHLVDAGREDHRCGEQERETRGVLVIEPADKTGDHGDARATDASTERAVWAMPTIAASRKSRVSRRHPISVALQTF